MESKRYAYRLWFDAALIVQFFRPLHDANDVLGSRDLKPVAAEIAD
jgi:hypothetical protein